MTDPPFRLRAAEKAFLTAKHAKEAQSSQSQNIVTKSFAYFAKSLRPLRLMDFTYPKSEIP